MTEAEEAERAIAKAMKAARDTAQNIEQMTGMKISEEEILLTADYYLDRIDHEEYEIRLEDIHRRIGAQTQNKINNPQDKSWGM